MGQENRNVPGADPRTISEDCALCIVGAGIAGLNALFAASRYLGPTDKVVLIDRNTTPGGMWTETYDYVRLHQPHRMFTAGDIPWQPVRDPAYLASKEEVLDHVNECLAQLRKRVTLVEYYGYEFRELTESPDNVEIAFSGIDGDKTALKVTAQKCVKAFGFRVPKNESLSFSSTAVHSVSPSDDNLFGTEFSKSSTPVYVIGGGKTGMDTAHALVTRFPDREVHLVVGRGTVFASRDKSFPPGLRRWFAGSTTLEYFLRLCLRYDGTNAQEIFDFFKAERAVHLPGTGHQYMFGLLSSAENETIANGISELIKDYVEDIVDTGTTTEILFRSGERRAVPRGSWFVNCTGYVMRQDYEYEPFLSNGGRVVSVQPTSGIHFLTTFAAYFLVHLFYLGELDRLPIYEMNYQALLKKDKVAFPFAAMTQVLYNISLIMQVVPPRVMTECGLDFDRWFPLHRRVFGVIKLRRNSDRHIEHFRKALDAVADKYDIACGTLAAHRR